MFNSTASVYPNKNQTHDNIGQGAQVGFSYSALDEHNAFYNPNNFNTSLDMKELDRLRDNLQANIAFLNLNRNRMRFNEFTELMNHHQYSLNVLGNMVNIKVVEANDPYMQNYKKVSGQNTDSDLINPYNNQYKAIASSDGTIKLATDDDLKKTYKHEWEQQFNISLNNPPCETLPPTSCFKLPKAQ